MEILLGRGAAYGDFVRPRSGLWKFARAADRPMACLSIRAWPGVPPAVASCYMLRIGQQKD
jgi:hypothetical protein